MMSLLSHLGSLFRRQREAEGAANASLMWVGAVRAVLFPRQHLELLRLGIFDKYIVQARDPDVLFHLSHRYYLSNTFTRRERIACALMHYRFEDGRYDTAYKEAVYGGAGIELWARRVDAVRYVLKLQAATELRHEGGVSVLLCADEHVICDMSYAWVSPRLVAADLVAADGVAARFSGAGAGSVVRQETIPFITKNQSVGRNSRELAGFRKAFPQNSPPYFCLAALHGIAQAHGMSHLAAIRHDCQVAFEERHVGSFRNSYCEFWKSFDAIEAGRVAHVMPVPLATPSILDVKAKHRRRALDRRSHWSEISLGTEQALGLHLTRAEGEPASARHDRVALSIAQMPAALLLAAMVIG